ncbi:MAG: phytanoyl-CoA dioxygenase family protein [Proteobacteria bacterium]|nr:phytanoyl-CoA dioxygenase family protein [Pseudomonadota bacterium]
MTKLARPITKDEAAAYRTNGVVLLRGVLPIAAVNTLRRSIDEAVGKIPERPTGYDLSFMTRAVESDDGDKLRSISGGQYDIAGMMDYVKSSGKPLLLDQTESRNGSFLLDTGVSANPGDFRNFSLDGAPVEIAAALLDSDQINFFGDQIFVKEPGTRERTAFHQDATYFEIDGDKCCVLWIPADPATLETGTMQYWRGSHRDGTLYQPNVFIAQTPLPGACGEPLPDIEGNLDAYDIVHFDVEPGDILVHHYRTVHGAGGNHSRYQVRRAASLRYCGDDIRFTTRPWAPKQLHHTVRLHDGDPLGGPDFPVVWRRRRGQEAA